MDHLLFDFIVAIQFRKRPFRAKFVPAKIWYELDEFKNNHEALAKYLKRFKVKLNLEFVTVSGEFDGDKQTIFIYIYDKFNECKFDESSWDEFKFALIQTIMHELIHWSQYSMRGDELCWAYQCNSTEQEYYSLSDEIQAYAHCIHLENMYTGVLSHSTRSDIFVDVFKCDYSNPALKEYVKWINRWERIYSGIINR